MDAETASRKGVEIWKPVRDFESQYEVSNLGRVRSLDRILERPHKVQGTVEVFHKGKILRPGPSVSGHLSVVLGRNNTRSVHSLVLEAFIGYCPPHKECLHRNGTSDDNRLHNLHWGTRKQNIADAFKHGTIPLGEEKATAKLKNSDIPKIRRMIKRGMPMNSIGKEFGVSTAAISQVRDGITWRHV